MIAAVTAIAHWPELRAHTASLMGSPRFLLLAWLCYPPITRRVSLDLPALPGTVDRPAPRSSDETPATVPATTDAAEPISESDRIADMLARGSLWAALQ